MSIGTPPRYKIPENAKGEKTPSSLSSSRETQEKRAEQARYQKIINEMIEYRENNGQKEKPLGFKEVPGSEFLKRSAKDIDALFLTKEQDEYRVDFHSNNGADGCVGIGDTSYKEKSVVVTDISGRKYLGVRGIVNGKVGYENIHWPKESPCYLAIHKNYSFRKPTEKDWEILGKGKKEAEVLNKRKFPTPEEEEQAKKDFQISTNISETFMKNPGEGLDAIEKIQGGFIEKIKGTADILGIDPNLMFAIMQKESLFRSRVTRREPHVVQRSLKKGYSPDDAEIMGTSYGYFQILGEGYKMMGYDTPQEFESAVTGNLSSQLEVYARYIRTKQGMLPALQEKNFQRIARLYNGKRYEKNNYDMDIKQYYESFKKSA
jgi:hypothetical protein